MNQMTIKLWDSLISDIWDNNDLGKAISKLLSIINENPFLSIDNEVDNINRDYSLMKDFMLQGYQDDKREELYNDLLRRTYRAACNTFLRLQIYKGNGIFTQANNRVNKLNISIDVMRQKMEAFVQDIAFLSLESEDLQEKRQYLYKEHHDFMKNVFYMILVSPQWNKEESNALTQLLLSPTIDVNDARLVISSITLSLINLFDINKLQALVNIYIQAIDEHCKQRALVGVAFSLPPYKNNIFPAYTQLIKDLCQVEQACKEILELQIQVFYCLQADMDNLHIQKEILPNIMKNNNLTITRLGIQEKEEDPLEDILHPDATDKAMEELEASFQKMKKMQEDGSDIYFGGFSQMKHFPFFNTISNWFVPFYKEHPELLDINNKLGNAKLLSILLKSGPFCDSDKYSFSLALSTIIDKIPNNMREMLNSEDAIAFGATDTNISSPAYIRRMYLQDMFRFFRISNYRTDFRNPFDYTTNTYGFFFANHIFADTKLKVYALEMCSFLTKRKRYVELKQVLDTYQHKDNLEFALLEANLALQNDLQEAQRKFKMILDKEPKHEKALNGYAQSSFNLGYFGNAEDGYSRLVSLFPDNHRYLLNLCVSQINNNHVDEGVKGLYRLDYELPNNLNVQRALGWGLMMQKNIKQAIGTYHRLLSSENVIDSDYLNAGYAYWFNKEYTPAIQYFVKYLSNSQDTDDASTQLSNAFENDLSLIQLNGISRVERLIMQDIIVMSYEKNG